MAGSGRRVFAPGEVLTASNTMNYLMDQTVMNFAGTAARGSAIGTAVSEGMVSYLADTNAVEVYDGSAWQSVYPSVANVGEIVQVVSTIKTDSFSTTSQTFVDVTGLSVSITPKSASNKVLIIVSFLQSVSGTSNTTRVLLKRNSTDIAVTSQGETSVPYTGSAQGFFNVFQVLDSPATTSSINYRPQVRVDASGITGYVGRYATNDLRTISTITAMEVVA